MELEGTVSRSRRPPVPGRPRETIEELKGRLVEASAEAFQKRVNARQARSVELQRCVSLLVRMYGCVSVHETRESKRGGSARVYVRGKGSNQRFLLTNKKPGGGGEGGGHGHTT